MSRSQPETAASPEGSTRRSHSGAVISAEGRKPRRSDDVGSAALVTGFGTAIAMWCLAFLARIPPAIVPSFALLGALLALALCGGFLAGRLSHCSVRAGAASGVVAAVVNLLILGSVLSGDRPSDLAPSIAIWIPGSMLLGGVLGGLGGALAGRFRASPPRQAAPNWTGLLALIAAFATLFLVMIGGLVTSKDAGLAVVDWPNSYGYNMFLYPLSRMVGNIYYEHAHRLFGSLVGLTILVLAMRLLLLEKRAGVKALGVGALLFVITQGVLGGLRVTGHFTMSDSPDLTRPNAILAMVHGVLGQVLFAWMLGLAAVTSRTWLDRQGRTSTDDPSTDRNLAALLVASLFAQLLLGVRARHSGEGLMLHATFAVVVLTFGILAAARVLGRYSSVTALRKTSGALFGHITAQIVLGLIAFALVSRRGGAGEAPAVEVVVATAHQTLGAILLGNAVLLTLWSHRLLVPAGATELPLTATSAEPR